MPNGFSRLDAAQTHFLENRAGGWSLQREGGDIISHVGNGHVIEAKGAFLQPCGAGAAAGQHEIDHRQYLNIVPSSIMRPSSVHQTQ